jgi:hypothetical protein
VTNSVVHGVTAKAAIKQIMNKVWIEKILKGIRDIVILKQIALAL